MTNPEKVISSLEQRVAALVEDNKRLQEESLALRRENVNLNDELDALYAEPQWFSHRGDYLVILAVVCILATATFYVGKVIGWW